MYKDKEEEQDSREREPALLRIKLSKVISKVLPGGWEGVRGEEGAAFLSL